jgi:hypothetical protein
MKAKMFVLFLVLTAVPQTVLTAQSFPTLPGGGLNGVFSFGNAVPVLSTEARYSDGIFTNDIDNYIDVNSYDPNIGTFVFLGGYPASNNGINDTVPPNYALSLGLGHSFRSFYLGVYYGGSMVSAWGSNDGGDPEGEESQWHWRNKIALLLGTSSIGAFRLDMILDTDTYKHTSDGEITGNPGNPPSFLTTGGANMQNAPIIALTWGTELANHVKPYITLGYQFSDYWKGDFTYQGTSYTGAKYHDLSTLGIKAGISYDLDESSYVSGDLAIAGIIGGAGEAAAPVSLKVDTGGGFLGAIRGSYYKKIDINRFAFGFKPHLALGFSVANYGDTKGSIGNTTIDVDAPSDIIFNLQSGIDLGFKYKISKRSTLYTGAGLQILRWGTLSHGGGDTENDSSEWRIDGLAWDAGKWVTAGSHLGFGMTYTPINNLVIGAGLNTFLDKFFIIDLQSMQIKSGSFWGTDKQNFLSYLGQIFDGLTFDLTVSYKF